MEEELRWSLIYEQIGNLPGFDKSRSHIAHTLRIEDPDLTKVVFYSDPDGGHDDVYGTEHFGSGAVYCLATYQGDKFSNKLPHKRFSMFTDEQLEDFSLRSERRLPTSTLIKGRDLVKKLEAQGKIDRSATECNVCMTLEQRISPATS
ncbi:hypothetical protein HYX05_03010 [Candidatus Woesearchaeota archaeon]|nr:hypothetical protein [Candidatus Woesearchaeota archaeon]